MRTAVLVLLVLVAPMTVAPAAGASAAGPAEVQSCTTIDEPGRYVLTASIESASADRCLIIAASDVVLDGQGHAVRGDGDAGSVGVLVTGASGAAGATIRNVTVRNLVARGWEDGVRLERVRSSTFRNNTVENNDVGVYLNATGNAFEGTTFRDNGWSIYGDHPDGASTSTTFVTPDFGFDNASLALGVRDVAVKPVAVGDRPALPRGKDDIGVFLNATATSDAGALTFDVEYDAAAVQGVRESTLSVWRHDEGWTDLTSRLDTGANTLSKNVTSFSVFAPLATNRSVRIEGTNAPVVAGETLRVTTTVENLGDDRRTHEVTLTVDGNRRDTASTTLAPGESRTVTLTWATGSGDAGNYTASVATPNDTAETAVVVTVEGTNDPPTVSMPAVEATAGEGVSIEPEVSDDGEIASYEWRVDGEVVSTDPALRHTFESAGEHEVTLRVVDDDGASVTVERTVMVGAPPSLGAVLRDNPRVLAESEAPGLVTSALEDQRFNVVVEGGTTLGVETDAEGVIIRVRDDGIRGARYEVTVSEAAADRIAEADRPVQAALDAYKADEVGIGVGPGPSGLGRLVTTAKVTIGKFLLGALT